MHTYPVSAVQWEDMEWTKVTQDRNKWRASVNEVNVSSGSLKDGEFKPINET